MKMIRLIGEGLKSLMKRSCVAMLMVTLCTITGEIYSVTAYKDVCREGEALFDPLITIGDGGPTKKASVWFANNATDFNDAVTNTLRLSINATRNATPKPGKKVAVVVLSAYSLGTNYYTVIPRKPTIGLQEIIIGYYGIESDKENTIAGVDTRNNTFRHPISVYYPGGDPGGDEERYLYCFEIDGSDQLIQKDCTTLLNFTFGKYMCYYGTPGDICYDQNGNAAHYPLCTDTTDGTVTLPSCSGSTISCVIGSTRACNAEEAVSGTPYSNAPKLCSIDIPPPYSSCKPENPLLVEVVNGVSVAKECPTGSTLLCDETNTPLCIDDGTGEQFESTGLPPFTDPAGTIITPSVPYGVCSPTPRDPVTNIELLCPAEKAIACPFTDQYATTPTLDPDSLQAVCLVIADGSLSAKPQEKYKTCVTPPTTIIGGANNISLACPPGSTLLCDNFGTGNALCIDDTTGDSLPTPNARPAYAQCAPPDDTLTSVILECNVPPVTSTLTPLTLACPYDPATDSYTETSAVAVCLQTDGTIAPDPGDAPKVPVVNACVDLSCEPCNPGYYLAADDTGIAVCADNTGTIDPTSTPSPGDLNACIAACSTPFDASCAVGPPRVCAKQTNDINCNGAGNPVCTTSGTFTYVEDLPNCRYRDCTEVYPIPGITCPGP